MKQKRILVCDHCENDVQMIQALSFDALPCIPWEWYKTKDFFKYNTVYLCPECKTVYRIYKGFDHFIDQTWGFFKKIYEVFKI